MRMVVLFHVNGCDTLSAVSLPQSNASCAAEPLELAVFRAWQG